MLLAHQAESYQAQTLLAPWPETCTGTFSPWHNPTQLESSWCIELHGVLGPTSPHPIPPLDNATSTLHDDWRVLFDKISCWSNTNDAGHVLGATLQMCLWFNQRVGILLPSGQQSWPDVCNFAWWVLCDTNRTHFRPMLDLGTSKIFYRRNIFSESRHLIFSDVGSWHIEENTFIEGW